MQRLSIVKIKMQRLLIALAAIGLIAASCRKGEDIVSTTIDRDESQELTNTVISGLVIDINEVGLTDAKVEVMQDEKLIGEINTAANGQFELNTFLHPSKPIRMQVMKEGFMTSMRLLENDQVSNTVTQTVLMPMGMLNSGVMPLNTSNDLIVVSGMLVDDSGASVSRKLVVLETEEQRVNYFYTGETGSFQIATQRDKALTLTVLDRQCRATNYTAAIGPFDSDQDLGTIEVATQAVEYYRITGQLLGCDGDPLTGGVVQAAFGRAVFSGFTNEAGVYSISAPECLIDNNGEATVTGYDSNYENASLPVTISLASNAVELEPIVVCSPGTASIEVFIEGVDTLSASNKHDFIIARDSTTQIFPLQPNTGFGLTLVMNGTSTGTFSVPSIKFTQGDLTVVLADDNFAGTSCEVTITKFETNTIEGSFTGQFARKNIRAIVPVSGTFAISK